MEGLVPQIATAVMFVLVALVLLLSSRHRFDRGVVVLAGVSASLLVSSGLALSIVVIGPARLHGTGPVEL